MQQGSNMETKLSIALLLTLVAASTALPVEQRKCLPMLFKSDYLGQVGQVMDGKTMRFSVMGTAYYDIAHKKQVSMQLIKGDGFTVSQTYIVDDNTRMSYSVDNMSGKCTKWANKAKPIEDICNDSPSLMPVGSLNVGDYVLDTYNYDLGIGTMSITFERQSFMMLNAVISQTIVGNEQMVAMQFGNMSTTGIPDSVWRIPASCNN